MSYVVFLSAVAALGGFLFGYDAAVISGTITQVSTVFDLNSLQQGWYVGSALIGSILGVSFADDSVEVMEFIISLEDEFGLEIPDQDIENLHTLSEIVSYIFNKQNVR